MSSREGAPPSVWVARRRSDRTERWPGSRPKCTYKPRRVAVTGLGAARFGERLAGPYDRVLLRCGVAGVDADAVRPPWFAVLGRRWHRADEVGGMCAARGHPGAQLPALRRAGGIARRQTRDRATSPGDVVVPGSSRSPCRGLGPGPKGRRVLRVSSVDDEHRGPVAPERFCPDFDLGVVSEPVEDLAARVARPGLVHLDAARARESATRSRERVGLRAAPVNAGFSEGGFKRPGHRIEVLTPPCW